jgi:hypothetical protein
MLNWIYNRFWFPVRVDVTSLHDLFGRHVKASSVGVHLGISCLLHSPLVINHQTDGQGLLTRLMHYNSTISGVLQWQNYCSMEPHWKWYVILRQATAVRASCLPTRPVASSRYELVYLPTAWTLQHKIFVNLLSTGRIFFRVPEHCDFQGISPRMQAFVRQGPIHTHHAVPLPWHWEFAFRTSYSWHGRRTAWYVWVKHGRTV